MHAEMHANIMHARSMVGCYMSDRLHSMGNEKSVDKIYNCFSSKPPIIVVKFTRAMVDS
jgi:hypothetical protein